MRKGAARRCLRWLLVVRLPLLQRVAAALAHRPQGHDLLEHKRLGVLSIATEDAIAVIVEHRDDLLRAGVGEIDALQRDVVGRHPSASPNIAVDMDYTL